MFVELFVRWIEKKSGIASAGEGMEESTSEQQLNAGDDDDVDDETEKMW